VSDTLETPFLYKIMHVQGNVQVVLQIALLDLFSCIFL